MLCHVSHTVRLVTYDLTMSLCLDDASEAQKQEFLHEIAQMKLLGAHQNIVSLVGCCTLQEHKFLVIEYAPFGDLLQWLRRRRRSVRRFPKENLNSLMFPEVFGSNGFHGNSVLKNSRVGYEIACGN